MYLYQHTSICIEVYAYLYVQVNMQEYVYVTVGMYKAASVFACVWVCVYVCIYVSVCVSLPACVYARVNVYMYTCNCMCICICVCQDRWYSTLQYFTEEMQRQFHLLHVYVYTCHHHYQFLTPSVWRRWVRINDLLNSVIYQVNCSH